METESRQAIGRDSRGDLRRPAGGRLPPAGAGQLPPHRPRIQIKREFIDVRQLANGYREDGDGRVVALGGRLNVRPAHQREFIYDDQRQRAVIDTALNGYPLNAMYWSKRADGCYELIDGQQRTISLARFVTGRFKFDGLNFNDMSDDDRWRITNYKLEIYICSGDQAEQLRWFHTINTSGDRLNGQELRNAVYAGAWLDDARDWFSKRESPAVALAKGRVKGSAIRQELLETALKWISPDSIEAYMDEHQDDEDALELWDHFDTVLAWSRAVFPDDHPFMTQVDWGRLHREHSDTVLGPAMVNEFMRRLEEDSRVTNKKGIPEYILTNQPRHLNIRLFTDAQKQAAYSRSGGICACCEKDGLTAKEMDADHITPWIDNGPADDEDCQMLCKECIQRKGAGRA